MSPNDMPDVLNKPEAGSIPDVLPMFLPKDLVIFPGLIVPLAVSDDDTIEMIDEIMQQSTRMMGAFLMSQEGDEENPDDAHRIGTAVVIHRMMRAGDGSIRMIIQGLERIKRLEVVEKEPFPKARVEVLEPKARKTVKLEGLIRAVRDEFDEMAELSSNLPDEYKQAVHNIDDPGNLADLIASNLSIEAQVRQQVLDTVKIPERLRLVRKLLERERQILQVGNKIQSQTKEEIEKGQREFYLRQQLKQIKKELGEDEGTSEADEWRDKIEEADLPDRVLEVANKEVERLERINPASAEYSVVTTYLDWLVSLPWEELSDDNLNLDHAYKVLEEDHYGLQDVKDRILEVLAVRKLRPSAQGPIICFVGPPGVGKTSLGKSIARAMNREFVRISLGGVRDEAEIRGHRRTYVGALPGRIIQSINKAGTRNPVFMMDEVDKLVSDFRGDPSSALLEVLDPAQNDTFSDHYLDIHFDLSKVFFITTANYIEAIPAPLRDRMEVIRIPGYITEEKVKIAEQYLVPRQIEENGLLKKHIRFNKTAIEDMVTYYTREAGVRNLERTIGQVCRKVARKLAEKGDENFEQVAVKQENLNEFLGPKKLTPSWAVRSNEVGVANGLAYTPYGGDVLRIETALMKGKGNFKVTGRLGDVMKESSQIAMSWIRAHQDDLGVKLKDFTDNDMHVHVPEGATPKDGPSAGITLLTSLASRYANRKVRADVAMTGEVTLDGHVLPIGGLREKVTAANRARIKHVIIPWDNQKDLEKVPKDVREKLTFHPVREIHEVLEIALMGQPLPFESKGNGSGGGESSSGRKAAKSS